MNYQWRALVRHQHYLLSLRTRFCHVLGLGSIEWKDGYTVENFNSSVQMWTGDLERRQNLFYFSTHESGSLYRYAVSRKIN